MGIIVRQSIATAVISYLGVGLGFIITIWLFPTILTPDQYGLTRVMLAIALVGAQLASLGANNTIVRFFPYFRDKEHNHRGFLFLSLAVPLIGFLIFVLLFLLFEEILMDLFEDKSALLLDYVWYIVPLTGFYLFATVLSYYTRALYDSVTSSFLFDIVLRVVLICILSAFFLGWIDFDRFILLFVANYGLLFLLMMVNVSRLQRLDLRPDFQMLDNRLAKRMLSYGMFSFLGGIATVLVAHIDFLMLGAMEGLQATAVYAVAFYVGALIAIPQRAIHKISMPVLAEAFKRNDLRMVRDIYERSSLNQIIAGALLFVGVWANLENLMEILPPEYAGGSVVVLIIGAAYLFDLATGVNTGIILTSKYYRFDLWSTLFLVLLTVTLNYLLIPRYGITGAAFASAAAVLAYNAIKYVYVWYRFSMQPFRWKMLAVLLIAGGCLFASMQTGRAASVYVDILLRSAAMTVVYLGLIFYLNLSEDLTRVIRQWTERAVGRGT